MPKSKSIRTLALIGLVVLLVAACADDQKPKPGTSGNPAPSASSSSSSSSTESSSSFELVLAVTAVRSSQDNYTFDTAGVERLHAGAVRFSLTNSDVAPHEARVVRVLDGNVVAYRAALDAGGVQGVASLGAEVASAGPTDSGKTTTATITLDAGTYVIVDFLPAPDGKVFAQHGLFGELLVVAA